MRNFSKIILIFLLMFSVNIFAEDKVHKLVIQVSTKDFTTQKIALSNAINVQKHYGMDNVVIELVAYGPGLELVTTKSFQDSRVRSLIAQDIIFTACGNTMDTIKRKTGRYPTLIDGVTKVQTGVARIIELQEQGYSYIRP